jgi:uncharacterized protein (TIGR03437 family)
MTCGKTFIWAFYAAMCWKVVVAQVVPSILKVEVQALVFYEIDTADSSKFGTNPNVTSSALSCTTQSFQGHLGNRVLAVGDIVAVNGQPAKGTYSVSGVTLCLSPVPVPGQPIADTMHGPIVNETYEFLQSDGTPVGTLMGQGLRVGGPSPPGFPAGTLNTVIVGGTGSFFGARGQIGNPNARQGLPAASVSGTRSITEDPANRRLNSGDHVMFTMYVLPLARPGIALSGGRPAVTHSDDFSLISESRPAVSDELLSLFASGLGPTRLGLDPGQPFPSSPAAVVNSPVAVSVNGRPAEVLAAVGLPGTVDGYQVNFRMPPGIAKAPATIQVSAAWIASPPVSIDVQ